MAKKKPDPETRVEWMDLDTIKPHPENPKAHDIPAIMASMRTFGFRGAVILDENTGLTNEGHGRIEALQLLRSEDPKNPPGNIRATHGHKKWLVPVVRGQAFESEDQARAFLIASNRLTELGGWDAEKLTSIWESLSGSASDLLPSIHFDARELSTMLAKQRESLSGAEMEEVPVPDLPKNPITRLGDVYRLGDHMLICGDATRTETWEVLGNVDAVFTSPPYAVGDTARRLRGKNATGPNESFYEDFSDDISEWPALMSAVTKNALTNANALVMNVQMLARNKRELLIWLHANRSRLSDIIVWDKGSAQPAMGAGVLNSQMELLCVFGKESASRSIPYASFRGTVSNVYAGNPARASDRSTESHGAVFPIHLPFFVMGTLCVNAKSWIDPFCGTGTSIMAAEQLGRVCHGIELSPAYCDVIVERWEQHTGAKAKRSKAA